MADFDEDKLFEEQKGNQLPDTFKEGEILTLDSLYQILASAGVVVYKGVQYKNEKTLFDSDSAMGVVLACNRSKFPVSACRNLLSKEDNDKIIKAMHEHGDELSKRGVTGWLDQDGSWNPNYSSVNFADKDSVTKAKEQIADTLSVMEDHKKVWELFKEFKQL